jgi:hypothetical protein
MKYIDVASVIRDGDSEKLKRLPVFIIRWIERIIMQERMNQILTKYADYECLQFLPRIIEEFNLTIEVDGKENLPESGRCFFLSNHPFGIIDGLVLTKIVGDKYHELKSIGNEVFLFVPHLRPLIAAVNVFGRNSKEYVNSLENLYNSDVPITHFPAGEVSRFYNGRIQDCRWQKSFITKSVSYKRNIVPFYIYGRNSRFFYSVSFLRRVLGIKSNIELILLPREMFRKENKTIKVKIGKPISHQEFDRTLSPWVWADKVRGYVYNLKHNPATVF